MKKTPLIQLLGLCCVAALCLWVESASAKEPTPEEVKAYQTNLFQQLDENNDGKVSEKEFIVAVLYAVFVDEAGKDGKLTRDEYFKKSTEATATAEWALMDPGGKGEIEFKDVFKNTIAIDELKKEFRKVDKKGRGFFTLEEIN